MVHSDEREQHFLEASAVGKLIRAGEISALEATRAQLSRIAAIDKTVGSYAIVLEEAALADAAKADADLAKGIWRGPLHGVPIGIKDLFWVAGSPTAAGTVVYRDFIPEEDATAVRRLRQAGAVVLGKLQLTEGAYSDHHPSIAAPVNPWNPEYWPGISSSGSAAALAAGLCFGALGTDTGGSIRWPCSATGITGLKPTWGRVSRHGVFELAASLDHVGTMARSAADAGLLFEAIAGPDPKDPTALLARTPDAANSQQAGVKGMRIGIDPAWNEPGVDDEVRSVIRAAIDCFSDLGADLVEVDLPDPAQIISDWGPLCAVEAAVAHEAVYPAQKEQYGVVLSGVLDLGRSLSAMDYQKAIKHRLEFRGRFQAAIQEVDLVLMPAQPFAPLTLEKVQSLGKQPELIAQLQRYTCPFNMTGNPTITLPGGFARSGVPIGFQLVAHDLGEQLLLRAGVAYQAVTTWHQQHPLP